MTFSILIELSTPAKQNLARLCSGLPTASWMTEENLYISLKVLEKLSDTERWDIMDLLGEIEVSTFSLKIQGLRLTEKRGDIGIIWATIERSTALDLLKHKIDQILKPFHGQKNEINHLYPAIKLGMIQKESPERVKQYFEAYGGFAEQSFEVPDFVFAKVYQTEKRSFYQVEKRYPLVKIHH